MKQEIEKIKSYNKKNVTLTLLGIEPGNTKFVPERNGIKKAVVRTTLSRFNKDGGNFSATEAKISGGVNVTNNSNPVWYNIYLAKKMPVRI